MQLSEEEAWANHLLKPFTPAKTSHWDVSVMTQLGVQRNLQYVAILVSPFRIRRYFDVHEKTLDIVVVL